MAFQFGQKLAARGVARGTCVIRGLSQDIFFPDWMWESLGDHAAQFPLVSDVRERLIKVDPYKPLQINNHWRKILFTGLLHSVICKEHHDCILDAFELNNVGVIRRLNILGFRRFERANEFNNENHSGFIKFDRDLFAEIRDPWALQKVRELDYFLYQLDGIFSDRSMLFNPLFLDDEEIASFYLDVYRLTRHELPVRGAREKVRGVRGIREKLKDVLLDMENYWANDPCVESCRGSVLFRHLLGRHENTTDTIKRHREPTLGSAVIDIPRIIVTHSIERDLLERAQKHSGLPHDYTRPEVIEGVRHMFSLYPQAVVSSFEARLCLLKLKINADADFL